jgi:hypothetical protein
MPIEQVYGNARLAVADITVLPDVEVHLNQDHDCSSPWWSNTITSEPYGRSTDSTLSVELLVDRIV